MTLQQSELYPLEGTASPQREPGLQHGSKGVNLSRRERQVSVVLGVALLAAALRRRTWGGALLALVGGSLLERGLTGHCRVYAALGMTSGAPGERGVQLERSITILRPREEVYRAWRDLEGLPRFSRHVRRVRDLGGGRSQWVAQGPGGTYFEWTAELTEDRPGERIAWRTLPGARLQHAGALTFRDAPGDRGTVLHLQLHYTAPGGRVGVLLAHLLGEEPRLQVADDLRRFKQLLETGGVLSLGPQPEGRRSLLGATIAARTS